MIYMKKILTLLVALSLFSVKSSAQDVLNEILRTSDIIINDTTKSLNTRKVALFKFDAMTYLRSKILPPVVMLDKKANADTLNAKIRFLNEQAYAMSVYISVYQKRMNEAKEKNRYLVTSLFKQATYDHKLFNDTDTEYVMSYYDNKECPIQFCLDCDWVKTLAFIRSIDWSKI